MQKTLFLTSNLSRIWHHGECRNKRVSNKGHQCPQRGMIKCLTEASICFCIEYFSLQFALQRQVPQEEKTYGKKNLQEESLSWVQKTTSLPCKKKFFLLDFADLFFIYLHGLGVDYGTLGFPFPAGAALFAQASRMIPPVSIPSTDTCALTDPTSVLNCRRILPSNLMPQFCICC